MRSKVLLCLMVLALAACSQEPAEQEAPAEIAPAGPHFALTLTSAQQLTLPEGSPIRISAADGGLRLEGYVANASSQLTTDGAFVAMGLDNEAAFAGNSVRVTFRARGAGGATGFESAYSTNGSGNSGWRRLEVTEAMSDVSYDFVVPAIINPADDYIGINPPEAGAIEIQSVRVEILPVEPAPPVASSDELRP